MGLPCAASLARCSTDPFRAGSLGASRRTGTAPAGLWTTRWDRPARLERSRERCQRSHRPVVSALLDSVGCTWSSPSVLPCTARRCASFGDGPKRETRSPGIGAVAATRVNCRRFPKQFGTVAVRARSRDHTKRSIGLPGRAFRRIPERSAGGEVSRSSSPFPPVSRIEFQHHSGTLERPEADRGSNTSPRASEAHARPRARRANRSRPTTPSATFQDDPSSAFGKPNRTLATARRPHPGRSVPR